MPQRIASGASALSKEDRISGGLIGLLVGDALGVPYEFSPASAIPSPALIEFEPPPGFRRAHGGVPPGTWSDDGAQALCLLASLLHCDRLDLVNFSNRLLNWYDHGYLAVDGNVFDIGGQTARALARIRAGVSPFTAGGNAKNSQGNGSLMRVLPLVLWHGGADAELVHDAHLQSCPTHGHLTVQVCCALYCLWARRILVADNSPWDTAVAMLREIYKNFPDHAQAFETDVWPQANKQVSGSGYVVDCLFSAKHALQAGDYQEVVKAAVALGNDTDTTACVAGGLAGLRDGLEAIPLRWRNGLRGKDDLEPLHKSLLEHCARSAAA